MCPGVGRFSRMIDEWVLAGELSIGGLRQIVSLDNAQPIDRFDHENRRYSGQSHVAHELVGKSARIQAVIEMIGRVAPTDSTALISGESGTGKELVARAIHSNSSRAQKPFVAINCAALTDTLLESELFGHEKGSFTGAITQKKGKLEVAEGGTVFLDEVGEMSHVLQAKVLRVLQEREFERVGGTKSHKLNIRLIAATNRDLRVDTQQGNFRQDLFYRLNVVSITVPPLRQRREDIPLLADYFVAKYSAKLDRPVLGISREAVLLLTSYDWPGNVRELENAIERAIVLGTTNLIASEDLPGVLSERREGNLAPVGLAEGVREAKRQIISEALDQAGGDRAKAAALLGIHANHLSRLITTLDLRSRRL